MNHEAQSWLPEWASKPAVRLAAGALALGAPFVACGGDDDDAGVDFTPSAAHTLTIEPTATPTPFIEATPTFTPTATPTLEPTATPTATLTPERVQSVPCEILPQEFCNDAELIELKTPDGKTRTLLGFKVPAGTPVFATIDGIVSQADLGGQNPWMGKGVYLSGVAGNDPRSVTMIGDLKVSDSVPLSQMVEKGAPYATVGDGVTNGDGYNLIVGFSKVVDETRVTQDDLDTIESLFPGIVEQGPAKTIKIEQNVVKTAVYGGSIFMCGEGAAQKVC